MALNRAGKNSICKKYWDILNFIYVAGNKVIYKTLLEEVCLTFSLVENKTQFKKIIEELVWADLIKVQRCKGGEALILRKGALIVIEGKENSQQVAAVPIASIDNRLKLSTLKIRYMLSNSIKSKINSYNNYNRILSYYEKRIFFNKNDFGAMAKIVLEIYSKLIKHDFETLKGIDEEYGRYITNAEIIKQNINGVSNNSLILKNEKYDYRGLDYQVANNCYFVEVKKINEETYDQAIVLKFAIFSYRDTIDEKKLGEVIAKTVTFYRDFLKIKDLRVIFIIVSSEKNIKKLFKNYQGEELNIIENATIKTKESLSLSDMIFKKVVINYLVINK